MYLRLQEGLISVSFQAAMKGDYVVQRRVIFHCVVILMVEVAQKYTTPKQIIYCGYDRHIYENTEAPSPNHCC